MEPSIALLLYFSLSDRGKPASAGSCKNGLTQVRDASNVKQTSPAALTYRLLKFHAFAYYKLIWYYTPKFTRAKILRRIFFI